MAEKFCGDGFLVQTEDTVNPGEFNTVGSMRDTSLSISNEQVDVTDKSSAKTRQLLAECGINSMSLSGAGLFSDEEAVIDLQAFARTGAVTTLRLISDYGDIYEGPFQVASFDRNGAYNSAEEFSVSFESASDIDYTEAP